MYSSFLALRGRYWHHVCVTKCIDVASSSKASRTEFVLNADDPKTIYSVRLLREIVASRRPIVLWVGAGASRWLG